jgi:hypothetical protein
MFGVAWMRAIAGPYVATRAYALRASLTAHRTYPLLRGISCGRSPHSSTLTRRIGRRRDLDCSPLRLADG